MSHDLFPFPGGGNDDFFPVRPYMIVGDGYFGRIVGKLFPPSVTDVDVDGVAISVELPHTGYGNFVPPFVVEALFPEVGRPAIGIFYPIEFPSAVE